MYFTVFSVSTKVEDADFLLVSRKSKNDILDICNFFSQFLGEYYRRVNFIQNKEIGKVQRQKFNSIPVILLD